jgi:hypothetical protein
MDGFSLVDLLLSLSIGALLSGTLFQSLIGDLQSGQRLTRLLRERQFQQRTLRLIASDVNRADAISPDPQHEQHACSLAGRLPVLHLSTSAGPITYSVGDAPSPIWRGQVLMRCGPAFALDGSWNTRSTPQNRVISDGLAAKPPIWTNCETVAGYPAKDDLQLDLAGSSRQAFSACYTTKTNLLAIRIIQAFRDKTDEKILTTEDIIPSDSIQ